jgi:hypothetical protein
MRQKIKTGGRPPTPPPTTATNATILPFPARAQRRMIERELVSVRDYDDLARYKWLSTVARRHRTRLRNLGTSLATSSKPTPSPSNKPSGCEVETQ